MCLRPECWGISSLRGEKVIRHCRELHTELCDLSFLPNITRVINSRRIRWVGHLAVWGRRRMNARYWRGNLKERDNLRYLGLYERIILKCI
jgi:5-methylcytosine-specific restriction endonuclease McrA